MVSRKLLWFNTKKIDIHFKTNWKQNEKLSKENSAERTCQKLQSSPWNQNLFVSIW